jgi:hypothetical protein
MEPVRFKGFFDEHESFYIGNKFNEFFIRVVSRDTAFFLNGKDDNIEKRFMNFIIDRLNFSR